MKKKRVLFYVLLILLFSFMAGTVSGQETFVTSKNLTVEDVKPFLLKLYGNKLINIYGVFQDNKEARIYYRLKVSGFTDGKKDSLPIVKLQSGKWFSLEKFEYLTK